MADDKEILREVSKATRFHPESVDTHRKPKALSKFIQEREAPLSPPLPLVPVGPPHTRIYDTVPPTHP